MKFKEYMTTIESQKGVVDQAKKVEPKLLIIARGLPGSGKSTTIKQYVPSENVFSTDDFWGPHYNFDIARIGEAHRWNQKRVQDALSAGIPVVGVDNTNVTQKEVNTYGQMASMAGYKVIIIESEAPWWIEISKLLKNKSQNQVELEKWADFLTKKNVHKVPKEAILRMMNRWVNTPELRF